MIEIRKIDKLREQDILLKNDSFPICGRFCPTYDREGWHYTIDRCAPEMCTEMCFPDESYDYDKLSGNTVFLGAYDGDSCIGLVMLQQAFFRYMYVADLKVSRLHRRQGIGSMLIQASLREATRQGYRGLSLIAQDNNLTACLFYIKNGFRIGGIDTDVYNGTSQEGKNDITFYLDAPQPQC